MPKPLLIISDAPTGSTGLGRIARDLATRIHEFMPEDYRVATFGFGATSSVKLPFPQYPMTYNQNYVAPELVKVWNDFAGDEKGIIFTIWNPAWTWWLSSPERLTKGPLRDFLLDRPFDLWGYIPVDGDGPNGTLPGEIGDILLGYDRLLAYTEYGAGVIQKTCELLAPVEHLPHGLNTNIFYRRDREEARRTFQEVVAGNKPAPTKEDVTLVGVLATNTPRKDWYLAFDACREMLKMGIDVGMWAHTDAWKKHWNLETLMKEFGMEGRMYFTNTEMTDEQLALGYTACDVTFGIGAGEGWGYPLAESLACGTPVIHGNYAGGAEFVPEDCLIDPILFHGDGHFAIRRPVFNASQWAERAYRASFSGYNTKYELPDYISWDNAWPRWREWLKEGLL